MPVGEIASHFDVSRPAVSQHLRVLKDAHLVTDSAHATRRVYALNREAFVSLRGYFDEFWSSALDAFKTQVERKSLAKTAVKPSARKRSA